MLRRIPAAGERQRHREARAGHAEQQTDGVEVPQRMGELPAEHKRHERQREPDQPGAAAADAIAEYAEQGPEERSAEQGHRDEQPALGCGECELVAKEGCQRPEQDPHHEADVEVHQRRHQGRQVAALQKTAVGGHKLSGLPPSRCALRRTSGARESEVGLITRPGVASGGCAASPRLARRSAQREGGTAPPLP